MTRSRHPSVSRAVVGVTLVLAAVFVAEVITGFALASTMALVPHNLVAAFETLAVDPAEPTAWLTVGTVFSTILVHADVMHLLFNVAYFWFFGTLLAQVAGDRWVLIALIVCAVTSAVAFVLHRLDQPGAQVIGASGAISGVAGLYVLLAVRWEIPWAMAWPLARPIPPLHAALVALFSVAMDLYVLRQGMGGGTAVEAHIGGFAGGLLLGAVLTTFHPTWDGFRGSRWGSGAP